MCFIYVYFWNRKMDNPVFELLAVSQSWIPYVQIDFKVILYTSILLSKAFDQLSNISDST